MITLEMYSGVLSWYEPEYASNGLSFERELAHCLERRAMRDPALTCTDLATFRLCQTSEILLDMVMMALEYDDSVDIVGVGLH